MKILLIDNYDSFTYNLYHYLSSLKCNVSVFRNDKISISKIKNYNFSKIVISPGPGNPNHAGNCLDIVKYFYKKMPIFGVCLGHQIIAQAFGSRIIKAKNVMHGKTSKIFYKKIGIFKNFKKGANIIGTRYHSLIVEKKSLNKNLIITAETENKIIMGIMHKKYNIHGVQFHPESIKTPYGLKLIKNFVGYKL
tara:strand:+ start:196 stop:774 length:579 start_codon:yes stop_codon:yes gene_type:complete